MKKIKISLLSYLFLIITITSFSQEDIKKRNNLKDIISTEVSFGLNYLTGNTNKLGANTYFKASAKDSIREFGLNARYLFNKTDNSVDQREISAGIQYDHFPMYILSPFIRAEAYSNRFQKIKIRYSGMVGLKYTFIKRPASEYSISAAFLVDIDKYTNDVELPIEDKYRLSTRFKFKQKLMENIYLVHETYYIPLIKNFSDYRIQSNSSLDFKVNRIITLKCTYNLDYNNRPIDEEVKKTDNKLFVNLTFNF